MSIDVSTMGNQARTRTINYTLDRFLLQSFPFHDLKQIAVFLESILTEMKMSVTPQRGAEQKRFFKSKLNSELLC